MNLNRRIINVDEDDFDFDEMDLLSSVNRSHSLDGLTTEEALSEGLIDIDDLPQEEREDPILTNEEIEDLDSIEF
jgi:signal-transduction protein with cAMP-binding, CBS, and nucleotidyltransferase domain